MTRPTVSETYDPWALGLEVHGTTGGEYVVTCPFHGDSHPSACFNPTSGLFFCFSCGATARVERLARHLGGRVTKTSQALQRRLPELDWKPLLASPLAVGHAYLRRRYVSDDQVRHWGVRALPGGVAIPVTDATGREVGAVVRREQGRPRYLSLGEKPPLWPLGWLMTQPSGSRLYVVEGIFGVLRAERAGLPAVAVLGARVSEEVAFYLRGFDVVVVFDDDPAGYSGAGRVLSLVPSARVVVPGREADELSRAEWREINAGTLTTRSLSRLAHLSGDVSKFYRQLPQTRFRPRSH